MNKCTERDVLDCRASRTIGHVAKTMAKQGKGYTSLTRLYHFGFTVQCITEQMAC